MDMRTGIRRILFRVLVTISVISALCMVQAATAGADDSPPVPENSGSGRRVVYDMGAQRVWLVEKDGTVHDSHLVSGHKGRVTPGVGQFWVFSRSRATAVLPSRATTMEYMVRFARGASGIDIGFHSIPMKHGEPLQSVAELGTPKSAGCVRQKLSDAKILYDWAVEGTWVVVVDSSGRAPQASLARLPLGPPPPPMPGDAPPAASPGRVPGTTAPPVSVGNAVTGWRS